jgi:glutamine synthetase
MMIFLAPQEEDYQRFSLEINRELFKKGKFTAPTNLSFGADNRTCAIRIPTTKKDQPNSKRLEYRIASANADTVLCLSSILLALSQKQAPESFKQIFGNAFDEQYKVKNFCQTLKNAEEKFFAEENFIRKKMLGFLG